MVLYRKIRIRDSSMIILGGSLQEKPTEGVGNGGRRSGKGSIPKYYGDKGSEVCGVSSCTQCCPFPDDISKCPYFNNEED